MAAPRGDGVRDAGGLFAGGIARRDRRKRGVDRRCGGHRRARLARGGRADRRKAALDADRAGDLPCGAVQLGSSRDRDDRALSRRRRRGGLIMCGIVGIVRFNGQPVRPEEIAAMSRSIVHRGPDDDGQLVEDGVGIGMRRLSIVDLSPTGHQPLFNETGSVAVVFNGEIYNHRDLRSRLESSGHTFRGTSDTEALVHGYEELGAAALCEHLSGMFAFAILDRERRRLFLARDGFGIKPVYLRRTAGQLSFASELRALAHDGAGPISIDPRFTHTFLRLGYVPSPASAFQGIEKLAPGTILDVDLASGETRVQTF